MYSLQFTTKIQLHLLLSEHLQILLGQAVAELLLLTSKVTGVLQAESSPLLRLLSPTEQAQLLVRRVQAVAVLLLMLLPGPVHVVGVVGVTGLGMVRVVLVVVMDRLLVVSDVPHHLLMVVRMVDQGVVKGFEKRIQPATLSSSYR